MFSIFPPAVFAPAALELTTVKDTEIPEMQSRSLRANIYAFHFFLE